MIHVDPVTLEFNGVRLEPLGLHHVDGLRAAAGDGELWNLRVTSVPAPHETETYVRTALEMTNRLAFAVVDAATDTVIGTTRLTNTPGRSTSLGGMAPVGTISSASTIATRAALANDTLKFWVVPRKVTLPYWSAFAARSSA